MQSIVFRNDLTKDEALYLCLNTEGEVDLVTNVQPEHARFVHSSPYAKLIHIGGNRVLAGTFNRYQDDVNFNDRNLRLALNLAINRTQIVNDGFYGYADLVPALTPPWAFDFPEELIPTGQNSQLARQLLQEAQWPEGRVLRIATPKSFENVARIIASQMTISLQIKVEVNVILPEEELKWKRVLAEKKLIPNWDIFLANPYALFYEGTPAYFHREFLGIDGAFRAGPTLPEFDELFEDMASETDQQLLLEKAKNVDRFVFNEALALFLCAPHDLYAVNRHVKFKPYRTTFELIDTEVTELHWSRNSFL